MFLEYSYYYRPSKYSSVRYLSSYSIKVALDKSPIEVSEAKKDLDTPIGLRLRLFLNGFYIGRIYYNTPRGNNKA